MSKNILIALCIALFGSIALTSCSSGSNGSAFTSAVQSEAVATRAHINEDAFWQENRDVIWTRLQYLPLKTLMAAAAQPDATRSAWVQLAIISKRYNNDSRQLVPQLIAWRAQNPNHPGNTLFPSNGTLNSLVTIAPAKHIALLLPLQGPMGASGQAVRDGFLSAYYESLAKTHVQQTITFLDTNSNPNISALYQQALSQGADMVVGPLTKDEVQTVVGGSFSVPTIALNYTDVWYGSLPNNFYEFGLSSNDEAQQVADKAWHDGHSHAIIIIPQNPWGERVSKTLITRWRSNGGSVTDTLYYNSQTDLNTAIANLLHADIHEGKSHQKENKKLVSDQHRRQDFDVIFLLAEPESARTIMPLLRYYYAQNIPVYSTSVIYSGSPNPQKDSDLNGVIFADAPWVLKASNNPNRLYAVGRDAYLVSNELPRLTELPNFPLYAATGALTMNANHQINRRLPWVKMQNGHP